MKRWFWLVFLAALVQVQFAAACVDHPCLLFSDSDRAVINARSVGSPFHTNSFNNLQGYGSWSTNGCDYYGCPNNGWSSPSSLYQDPLFKAWIQDLSASSWEWTSGITALMNHIAEAPTVAEIDTPEEVLKLTFAADLAWDKLTSLQQQTVVNKLLAYIDPVRASINDLGLGVNDVFQYNGVVDNKAYLAVTAVGYLAVFLKDNPKLGTASGPGAGYANSAALQSLINQVRQQLHDGNRDSFGSGFGNHERMGGLSSEGLNYIIYGNANFNTRAAKMLEKAGIDSYQNIMGPALYYPLALGFSFNGDNLPLVADIRPSDGTTRFPADTYAAIYEMQYAGIGSGFVNLAQYQMDRVWAANNNGNDIAHPTHGESAFFPALLTDTVSTGIWTPDSGRLFRGIFFQDNKNFPPWNENRKTSYPDHGVGGKYYGKLVFDSTTANNGGNEVHLFVNADAEFQNHNPHRAGEIGLDVRYNNGPAKSFLKLGGRSGIWQGSGSNSASITRIPSEVFGNGNYYVPVDYVGHGIDYKVLGRMGDMFRLNNPTVASLQKSRRTVVFTRGPQLKHTNVVVSDEVLNGTGTHEYHQFWHTDYPAQQMGNKWQLDGGSNVKLWMRWVTSGVTFSTPSSRSAITPSVSLYKNAALKSGSGDTQIMMVARIDTPSTETPIESDFTVQNGQGTKVQYSMFTDVFGIKDDDAAEQMFDVNGLAVRTDAESVVLRFDAANTIIGFMAGDASFLEVNNNDIFRVFSSQKISISVGGELDGQGGIQITPVQSLDIPSAPLPDLLVNLPSPNMVNYQGQPDVWWYGVETQSYSVSGGLFTMGNPVLPGPQAPQIAWVVQGVPAQKWEGQVARAQLTGEPNTQYNVVQWEWDGAQNPLQPTPFRTYAVTTDAQGVAVVEIITEFEILDGTPTNPIEIRLAVEDPSSPGQFFYTATHVQVVDWPYRFTVSGIQPGQVGTINIDFATGWTNNLAPVNVDYFIYAEDVAGLLSVPVVVPGSEGDIIAHAIPDPNMYLLLAHGSLGGGGTVVTIPVPPTLTNDLVFQVVYSMTGNPLQQNDAFVTSEPIVQATPSSQPIVGHAFVGSVSGGMPKGFIGVMAILAIMGLLVFGVKDKRWQSA